jgi:hypothetical protein
MLAAGLLMLTTLQGVNVPPVPARTTVARARAVTTAPRLDGRLDEPVWAEAEPITGFIQRQPEEGEAASEPTEVRVIYTGAALFIGVRASDAEAASIAAPLSRRDEYIPADWVAIVIDSWHDRRSAFEFAVNPAGVKRDVYRFNDNEEDPGWNAVWDVATSRDDTGWTAEFRIPVSQLRLTPDASTFGFNVWRRLHRRNELQYWQPVPRSGSGMVSLSGTLEGLGDLTPRKPLEVAPYVLASSTLRPDGLTNPFERGTHSTATAGADLRIGLTSGLTLTAAINPDFGQVDADPAEVNLSAFETFFPERRPFFTEGVDLFQFPLSPWRGGDQLFYSRRIGRAPQLDANGRGGYVEPVRQTRILGAGKLSGRAGAWQVGMLGAVTAQAEADVIAADHEVHRDVVEPATAYLVGRTARDWRRGQTVLGAFGTAVVRRVDDATDGLRSRAVTMGTDLIHRFRHDTWSVRAQLAGSRVQGSPEAIVATQRSSAHWYQRPDQAWVTVDSAATSLEGIAGSLTVGKHAGGAWTWSASAFGRSPGFESNDLGFMRWAGRYVVESGIGRRWLTPTSWFREASVRVGQWGQWTWGGERHNLGFNTNLAATFHNFWTVRANVWRGIGGLDLDQLRGGPALHFTDDDWFGFGVESDPRGAFRFGMDGEAWRWSDDGTYGIDVSPRLTWRPDPRHEWSVAPRLQKGRRGSQLVESGAVNGRDEYVVARLEDVTTSLTLRGNLTFTPTLTLQGYAEPFISSGRHAGFRRVAEPRARTTADRFESVDDRLLARDGDLWVDFDRDGTGDLGLGSPDFTTVSLRSNLVLRWEYRPGSTLFLVWQHGREHDSAEGGYSLSRGFGDLRTAPATNVLLVKLSYWLGR